MKHKRTVVAVVAIAVLGVTLLAPTTKAATNWKDYFSKDEGKAIAKLADKYIREQLDDNAKDWKGLISSKQVDSSIAKKKIYTFATPACSVEAADKVLSLGTLDTLWKKISADEIELSKTPIVNVYGKVSGSYPAGLASEVWTEAGYYLSEGTIWIEYGDDDDDEVANVFDCSSTSQYKISISY